MSVPAIGGTFRSGIWRLLNARFQVVVIPLNGVEIGGAVFETLAPHFYGVPTRVPWSLRSLAALPACSGVGVEHPARETIDLRSCPFSNGTHPRSPCHGLHQSRWLMGMVLREWGFFRRFLKKRSILKRTARYRIRQPPTPSTHIGNFRKKIPGVVVPAQSIVSVM